MKSINKLMALPEEELREELMTYTMAEITELVMQLIEERPKSEKVAITEEQFKEHFRIITRTGKRGRPSRKEEYEILNGITLTGGPYLP